MNSRMRSVACTFCKKRKRKCDGETPCSICLKYNKNGQCEYFADQDKRKFKYDSTFIDYLELKVDILRQLADELIRSNPTKAEEIDCELVKLQSTRDKSGEFKKHTKTNNAEVLLRGLANENAINELTSTKWRVRQDVNGHTEFYGPISGRQQIIENAEVEEGYPTTNNKVDIVVTSDKFRHSLIDNFAKHFAKHFYISWISIDELKQWQFPSPDISKQLLLCSVFTYGATFVPNYGDVSSHFLHEAESIALRACKNPDEHTIHALLILSCYKLGMGQDSTSWTFDAMSSALTQFIKLDRLGSKDPNNDEKLSLISLSPRSSALFWSVIMQDRIITSVLGRGCRIQYFRITTPFHSPSTNDPGNPSYIYERVFAYHSRLWYIHDKFMGQIYSFKAEYLHTSHRLTLMNQGVEDLENFKNSLPLELSLNDTTTDSTILTLHLSYSVAVLLLHRAYLNQIPLKVIQVTIEHCAIAANLIQRLYSGLEAPDAPYFLSYLILTCATFDLFLLSNKDKSVNASSLERVQIYVRALYKFGEYWKRCIKDIKVLTELAKRWDLDLPFLAELLNESVVKYEINDEELKFEASDDTSRYFSTYQYSK